MRNTTFNFLQSSIGYSFQQSCVYCVSVCGFACASVIGVHQWALVGMSTLRQWSQTGVEFGYQWSMSSGRLGMARPVMGSMIE